MSFYLKPPRGQINYHKLEECVKQRITCYYNLTNTNDEFINFDCLIEDSALDRTGHFIFRLLACYNSSFRNVFLQNEQKLLLVRLGYYDDNATKCFLKMLLRQSKDILKENEADEKILEVCLWLFKVCCQLLSKEFSRHIFEESSRSEDDFKDVNLKVPFHLCTSLIINRDVALYRGFVILSCEDWKKLLFSLFDTYLRRVLDVMKHSRSVETALCDDRVREVLKVVENHWFQNTSITKGESTFDVKHIGKESKFFPLCMLNLYKVLEKTNRLSHNDRFDFSLYMKGIGVSLSDSQRFWESAYSKQHSSCSKCTHSWEKNEKRYIYGIRHLYGLEGSRKDYQMRSCRYLQEKSLNATEDGGCSFKHFDDNNLRTTLKKLLPNKEDDIEVMIYERKENPSEACRLFYEIVFKSVQDKDMEYEASFHSPVEYYLSLKKAVMKQTENGNPT